MSNYDSKKRPRPEHEPPFDSADSEEGHPGHQEVDQTSEIAFRTKKLRTFTTLNSQEIEYAVGGGGNNRRHLSSLCSPQYATSGE